MICIRATPRTDRALHFSATDFAMTSAQIPYGTFDVFTMNADGTSLTDILANSGQCPNGGNCVTPVGGAAP